MGEVIKWCKFDDLIGPVKMMMIIELGYEDDDDVTVITQLLSDSCQQLFSNWDTPAPALQLQCCKMLQGVLYAL